MNALVALFSLAIATPAVDADAFRNSQPTPAPVPTFAPPDVTTFVLDNGARVFLVEQHALPIVTMSLSVPRKPSDPDGKSGLNGLCMSLMGEGTRALAKSAFEERKADLGLSLWFSDGSETNRVAWNVTKSQLSPAMDLVMQALTQPGLRSADLERVRARAKAAVLQSRGSADAVGARVQPRVFYGAKHAFGQIVTDASLDAVALADCDAVAAALKPKGADLFIAGDVTPAEVKALFARYPSWKGNAPAHVVPPSAQPLTGTVFFVDVPGAAQSRVSVLQEGPKRSANDTVALQIMASIWGGGFSSRINMNLREKNGFTYGARGGFTYRKDSGMFTTYSSVRTDATGPALREIAKELHTFLQAPPTTEELVREKEGTVLSLPGQFANMSGTLSAFEDLAYYGLPLDFYKTLPSKARATSAQDVWQLAKKHLREKNVKVLVVGDGAKIRADLDAIAKEGLFGAAGDVVVLDVDGNVKN